MTSDSFIFKAKRGRVLGRGSPRWANRSFAIAGGATFSLFMASCATTPETLSMAANVPSSNVSRIDAWRDAERLVSLAEGRVVVMGQGGSMQPILGANTVLVLNRVQFTDLKAGMQVAYINRERRCVVHALSGQDGEGWRVRGLNNPVEDRERVTASNLLGVVYASFATSTSETQ